MALSCGIVGLPNVGKSTLFNALTSAKVEAQNYPFCTIDPHVGVVAVQDSRLQAIADIVKPEQIIPTSMEFVDIAGLVRGASKGEGLGNKFLANIRETDAIVHVVRCFTETDVIHVDNKVDPIADIETIHTELLLADLESVERAITKNKKDKDMCAVLEKLRATLDAGKLANSSSYSDAEQEIIKSLNLLTIKPVMYIANVAEDGFSDNPMLAAVSKHAEQENAVVLPISAKIEAELAALAEEEKQEFLQELGLSAPGLDRLIAASYKLLGLETYFTAGKQEVRAWTIPIGATAPQAAGKIHTDFEKGFIRAEVISYKDYIEYHGEQGAKDAGKWRLEGKDYIVQDGDIVHFRFNV